MNRFRSQLHESMRIIFPLPNFPSLLPIDRSCNVPRYLIDRGGHKPVLATPLVGPSWKATEKGQLACTLLPMVLSPSCCLEGGLDGRETTVLWLRISPYDGRAGEPKGARVSDDILEPQTQTTWDAYFQISFYTRQNELMFLPYLFRFSVTCNSTQFLHFLQ